MSRKDRSDDAIAPSGRPSADWSDEVDVWPPPPPGAPPLPPPPNGNTPAATPIAPPFGANGNPPQNRQLGELLVESGAVTRDAVQNALKRQRRDRRPLGELLLEHGLSETQLVAALGLQQNRLPVDLEESVDEESVHWIDADFAREHEVLPLFIDEQGRLHVAAARPQDLDLAAAVQEVTGRGVVLELATGAGIRRGIDRYYDVLHKVDAAVERAVVDTGIVAAPASYAIPLRADAPVVEIVNLILTQGLRSRASDIHIESQSDRLRIRYRVDGALHDVQSLPRDLGPSIASRLKIMADMDIVDRHRAQDGQIALELDGRAIDIRVATMETVWGEKVVMRLLDRTRSLVSLERLGLDPDAEKRLRRLVACPFGLIIVSGPTGAGKTTTLYSALNELDRQVLNITTIEDPVEYHFENINQIQINKLAGVTFANGLRAILRQDPDVILVGEVRDAETASIAVQAALTGHLVLCSVHASDCVGAVYRFLDMGIESFLVASALVGVIAQRLTRTTCQRCITDVVPRSEEVEFYRSIRGRLPGPTMRAGAGCQRCDGTGYYGRTGVFECLQVDEVFREMIVRGAPSADLRKRAVETGMRTLQDASCDLVDANVTTLTETLRSVYMI